MRNRSFRVGALDLLLLGCVLCAAIAATAQEPVISEFLAVNRSGLEDEDGDRSDWIEVLNPGPEAIDLDGWHLTDDPFLLPKWRFPARRLAGGEFLIVFASGKNRAPAEGELHANFRLSGRGEYVAIVTPGGVVAHEYPPPFAEQFTDVSYGIAQSATTFALVTDGSPAAIRVPTDGSDGLDWTLPEFDDSGWQRAATPVGFDTDGGEVVLPGQQTNLARSGTATQSSTGFGGVASRAIDGNNNPSYGGGSITHTATGDGSPWWEVDLRGTFRLDRIVLWNRLDCCSHRLTDFRVRVLDADRGVVVESEHFADGGFPPNQSYEIDLPPATSGRLVRIERLGPDREGQHWLSLAEVEVFEGDRGLGPTIATDVQDSMLDASASIYARWLFEVDDPAAIETLTLGARYDDGFVAYLNGAMVASRNAPPAPVWSSRATAERPDDAAVRFEEIPISSHRERLRAGINVLAVHGLNLGPDDGDFLLGVELRGRSVAGSGLRYFPEPTPGAVNDTPGVVGVVGDTTFSVDRGFFDAPFDVEITSATPGAIIRYTVDGSEPTESRGTVYTRPIRIAETTTLRAAAFRAGFASTNVDTHTYIFLDDVIASRVMNRGITESPEFGPQMHDALTDLPTISLVTGGAVNDVNEVPVSVELILPDGSPGFQEDAGVRYYGGAFTNFAKKNFRLYFRAIYGDTKLRYPLFEGHERGIRAVEVFDQLELRGGSHDMNQRGFYMSNRFTDDTMLDMGNLNPHGRFVHLYRNGVYWGQYHLRERWNADMLASYLGGDRNEYESINGNWNVGGWPDPGVPYDGDGSAWARIKSLRDDYEAVKPYLDVPHYVDYMLMFMFGNSEDEYRCVGPVAPGSGFKFFLNDADGFTRDGGDRTAMRAPGRLPGDGPGSIFSMLFREAHPDYMTLLGDRIHKHFFNDGAMTPARNTARLLERCAQVERAFIAESARWGFRTPASWASAKNAYVRGVLPTRTRTVVAQFRSKRFYPVVEAPQLDRRGGAIAAGFELGITAPAGTVLYTLDGSDPRLPGGGISPTARVAGDAETVVLLPAGAGARALVPTDGALGLDWTAADFNDSDWLSGQTGVGYERAAGFESLIALDVHDAMYGVSSSVYIRIPFTVEDPEVDSLTLLMKYDDGYTAYLNGERIAAKNAPGDPRWDSGSTGSNADSRAVVFEGVDVSSFASLLRAGRNVLAIHGLNTSSTSNDALFLPQLEASRPLDRQNAIILDRTTRVRARAVLGGQWSALDEALFVVHPSPLRITEIMYHPPAPPLESPHDDDDFEFVEIQNTGDAAVSLMGIRLTGGIFFDFPERGDGSLDLAPGETVLVVKDLEAFASRYDTDGLSIAGEYGGRLDNDGERIVLGDVLGNTLLDFEYSDAWYPATDGGGRSLEIVDARAGPERWGLPGGWRPGPDLGSPGVHAPAGAGGLQRQGDLNQDGVVNISDAVAILVHLFIRPRELPCGGDPVGEAGGDDANRRLLDVNADEEVSLSDAVFLLEYLFLEGPIPALGTGCVRIAGCPEVCGR